MCVRPAAVSVIASIGIIVLVAASSHVGSAQVAWFLEIVDDGVFIGTATDSARDGTNRTHIAFFDARAGSVEYVVKFSGAWQVETVEAPGYVIGPVNIALDAGNRPHVSYCDGARLRYAVRGASFWSVTTIDDCHTEGANGLALGRDGFPRVAYAWNTGVLRFALWSGSAWVRETVERETVIARYISVALDDAERPHISYSGNGNLRHAAFVNTMWVVEVVDPSERSGRFARLALDSRGWPRIAYYDPNDREVQLASWNGTTRDWTLEVIDSDGDPGWDLDLAVDRGGRSHISYYERLSANLRYALKDGSAVTPQTVDRKDIVGWFTSITTSPAGFASIAYFDPSNGELRLAVSRLEFQVLTVSAAPISPDRVSLQGELTCLGALIEANAYFEWRAVSGGSWNRTTPNRLVSHGPFSAELLNLSPGETYEARAVGEGGGLTTYGEVVQFEIPVPSADRFPWTEMFLGLLVGGACAVAGVAMWFQRRKPGT